MRPVLRWARDKANELSGATRRTIEQLVATFSRISLNRFGSVPSACERLCAIFPPVLESVQWPQPREDKRVLRELFTARVAFSGLGGRGQDGAICPGSDDKSVCRIDTPQLGEYAEQIETPKTVIRANNS